MSETRRVGHVVLFGETSKDTGERYQPLLEDAGYEVAVVAFEDAAAAAQNLRPSVIILQFDDPARTGLGMVRSLRTQAETRATPIVALIGFDNSHTREQIVRAGASAILIDPVKAPALRRHLQRLLTRANGTTRASAESVASGASHV